MLFFLVGWLYVLLAPYTKVEESFNLHATHDILFHGSLPVALKHYDHFIFPGVVPRSFIGSLVLGYATKFITLLANTLYPFRSKFELQVLVRLLLATVNASGLFQLQRAVARRFGLKVSAAFIILTCTQFHLPFWMGRTLPNMFALYPVNVALTLITAQYASPREQRRAFSFAIALLTFTAVTLRSELILLLGPLVLHGLYFGQTKVLSVIKIGLASGILSLALTVSIDSYFWDRWPLWPEVSGLYFNVYEGKSSEWGTSPPHSYFTAHLPKLLMSALPLSVVGLLVDARMRTLLFPFLAFVALLSCLGHKEWRFIIYVVPIWNIVGARGATWLLSRSVKTKVMIWRSFLRLVLIGFFALNIMTTVLLMQASIANYPGGEAIWSFNNIVQFGPRSKEISIHIDNYAAQTGASLFLHEHAPPRRFLVPREAPLSIVYNKTENLNAPEDFWKFDWVITDNPEPFLTPGVGNESMTHQWKVRAIVDGFRGVELGSLGLGLWKRLKVPRVHREPKVWLLEQGHGN